MRDFATAVKAIATDESLTHDELVEQLCDLADAALKQATPSRVSLVRSKLISKRRVARAMLAMAADVTVRGADRTSGYRGARLVA